MLDTGQLPLTGNALLLYQRGLGHAAAEEYEEAVVSYNGVLQARPDFYEVWYERGLALERLGSYTDAIASFDRALHLRPRNDVSAFIWCDRGNALQFGLGQYEEAITCYDRVLQINPNHPVAWLNRGNALLYGLARYEEAIASYNRTLHLKPDQAIAWRNRGNALVELKRYSDAISSYDQALALEPDDQIAWQARESARSQSGLNQKQPTTNPVWYGRGFADPTYVEEDERETLVSSVDIKNLISTSQPIFVIEDDAGRREITLHKKLYVVGRDPKSDLCLQSQFASRHHATLIQIPCDDGADAYQIIDGNLQGKRSTNGLVINGKKRQVWNLENGDVIVFGPKLRATYYASGTPPTDPLLQGTFTESSSEP